MSVKLPFDPCQSRISATIKGRQIHCQYMLAGSINQVKGLCVKKPKVQHTPASLNLGYVVCRLNLPSIIPVLNFCPLHCPDCIIAWLPKSSLNRHFLYLRATINHPFTHPSTQHFCHRYTSLPPSTGAPGPSQTHKHNHCQPQLFPTPVLCDFLFLFFFW